MRATQRGTSLVELMVGLTVGLVVLAAAVQAMAQHLRATQRQMIDARVSQDARVIADLAARELRRAGHWDAIARGQADATRVNPHADIAMAQVPPGSAGFAQVTHTYGGTGADARDAGFCSRGGVAYLRMGGAAPCGGLGWQALNDPAVTRVVELTASVPAVARTISLLDRCTRPVCADGSTVVTPGGPSCGPRLTVREVTVRVVVRATRGDDAIRSATQTVRVANDALADLSQSAHRCPGGEGP
jgi:prepilin peptidase dependent protein B